MVYIFKLLSFSIVVIHPSWKSRYAYSCFLGVSSTASNKCISKKGQRPGPSLVPVKSPRYHRTTVTPISFTPYEATCLVSHLELQTNSSKNLWWGCVEMEKWMSEDNPLVHPYTHQLTWVRLLHCPSTHSLLTQAIWAIALDFCNEWDKQ